MSGCRKWPTSGRPAPGITLMATCNHTVATTLATAIEHLGKALQALQQAQQAAGDVRVAALYEASVDLHQDTLDESRLWAPQEQVTVRAEQEQAAPVLVMQSAAQVTEPAAPQYDRHVLDYRDGQAAEHRRLLDEARTLGLKVARNWKASTIASKIAEHKTAKPTVPTPKPETPAPAATLAMAATVSKTATVEVPLDREAAIRRLLTLSDSEFAALAAMVPATNAAA